MFNSRSGIATTPLLPNQVDLEFNNEQFSGGTALMMNVFGWRPEHASKYLPNTQNLMLPYCYSARIYILGIKLYRL